MFKLNFLLATTVVFCLLTVLTLQGGPRELNYPLRIAYINRVSSWWGPGVTRDLGVPGETTSTTIDYNVILLGYWTCQGSPHDIAQLWASIGNYGVANHGSGTQEIQASLRKKYNDNGMRVLVSAFGNY